MASRNVITVDDENFEREVLGSKEPFLLDFSAVWCAPCKTILPLVEKLADDNVGRFKVGKIDIDDAPGVARRLGIRGAPTLVVFKDGIEVRRHVGACGKEKLASLLL
jgi:thioredoxin 1